MALRMQYQAMSLLKSLLRYEKNQQVMCNAHFVDDILATCKCALYDETHFLHALVQHVFERLAAQSIHPKCLRDYLRAETIFDPLVAHVSLNRGSQITKQLKHSTTSLFCSETPKRFGHSEQENISIRIRSFEC
jgi:hypothetical protein